MQEFKNYTWQDYVRFNPFMPQMMAHGPVANWAEENKGYWVLDIIASAQLVEKVAKEYFQFWTLTIDKEKETAYIKCTDGDRGSGEIILYEQTIPYVPETKKDLYVYCITEGDAYTDEKGYINKRQIIVFPEDR